MNKKPLDRGAFLHMIRFHIITLFPGLFNSFLSEGIVARAQKKKRIVVHLHNPRDVIRNKHKTADDRPYGGGVGMLMKIDPLVVTLHAIRRTQRSRIILLTPTGKQFTQRRGKALVKNYNQLILICGRYEGIDARIKHYIDEEVSIGPYILNGGEVAAMVIIETAMRLVPGVLGNRDSLVDESHEGNLYEYPQFTRPEEFDGHKVPQVLLSGDHKAIAAWREKQRKGVA